MTVERVLAVFAHPDDESLVAGGTLAACAAAGLDIMLVSATRGEQGPSADLDRATLGAVREAELMEAARTLGVHRVECLGYPDGGLDWAEPAELGADLARRLWYWRPRAVLTFGPEGLYWHPDHIVVHELIMASVESAATEGLSPWVYQATWPRGRMAELVAAMAARGLPRDLWGLPAEAFGVPAASITTVVDVRRFLAAKVRALRSYRSQLASGHLLQAITEDLALEFLGHEYFVRAGPPVHESDWLVDVVSSSARRFVSVSGPLSAASEIP